MTSVANAIVSPNLAAAPAGQHYVYKTVRGNGTIVARVNSLGNTSAASEAGLVSGRTPARPRPTWTCT